MSHDAKRSEHSNPRRYSWEGSLAYKLYNYQAEAPFSSAETCTVGEDGLTFCARETLPLHSILILKLYRYNDYAPVKVLAKVMRCEFRQSDARHEVECVFHDLSREERAVVKEIVEEIDFIQRIRNKVQETLKQNGIHFPTQPAPEKEPVKHGSKRTRKEI